MKALNKILGKLPGNQWKTWMGFVALLVAMKLPAGGAELEMLKHLLEYFGWGYGSLGALHKVVKEVEA